MIKATGSGKIKGGFQKHSKVQHVNMRRGIIRAGLFIQADSMKRTPVKTSTLKNSARSTTRVEKKSAKKSTQYIAEITYGTHYAIYVHEMVQNYHRNGEAKFLENAIRQNKKKIQQIIFAEMK